MNDNARSRAWIRLAVVYFAIAVGLGIVMGASADHTMMPVHAHLNLLGWASMALFGLVGMAWPSTVQGALAGTQFWLHNLALPVMLGALAWRLKGHAGVEPVIGLASVAVGVSVALFAWLVLTRVGAPGANAAAKAAQPR